MRWALAAAALAAFTTTSCAFAPDAWLARGVLGGDAVETMVDSPAAAALLADVESTPTDASLAALATGWADRVPNAGELAEVSRRWSPDVAALMLWRQLDRRAAADELVASYRRALALDPASPKLLQGEVFVFVPGWLYRSDPGTGADLARQARLLASQGARVIHVKTDENGTVEANAARVVGEVRLAAADSRRITLVSASKGGAEVALALSSLAHAGELDAVHAWVNIGGTLRGTRLADLALSWPACWLVQVAVLKDGSFDALRSLASAASAERAAALLRPAHVREIGRAHV